MYTETLLCYKLHGLVKKYSSDSTLQYMRTRTPMVTLRNLEIFAFPPFLEINALSKKNILFSSYMFF